MIFIQTQSMMEPMFTFSCNIKHRSPQVRGTDWSTIVDLSPSEARGKQGETRRNERNERSEAKRYYHPFIDIILISEY